MAARWERQASLTGAMFAVLMLASFVVIGETPGADDPAAEVAAFYADKESQALTSAIVSALGAVFLLFFVGSLGGVLRSAEGANPALSTVAQAGGVVAAVGVLIFAGLLFTLGDAADTLEPEATQALNALNADFFFPLAGGMATFLLASGLVAVRRGGLPVWLGWAALVIAVAIFSPLGFVAFLASIAWVLVASIVLALGRPRAPTITG